MRARYLVALLSLAAGCANAWAQPRHDGGVRPPPARHRDAGVSADVLQRPPTHGRIDPAAAQRVIHEQSAAVRQCYQVVVAHDPTVHGQIELRIRVEPDGRVSETTSGGDPSLQIVARCIEGLFAHARFPPPTGGAATVTAPFVFAAAE